MVMMVVIWWVVVIAIATTTMYVRIYYNTQCYTELPIGQFKVFVFFHQFQNFGSLCGVENETVLYV